MNQDEEIMKEYRDKYYFEGYKKGIETAFEFVSKYCDDMTKSMFKKGDK